MSACPYRACEGRPAGRRLGGSPEQGGVTSHSQQRMPRGGWSSPLLPPGPGRGREPLSILQTRRVSDGCDTNS